MAISRWEPGEQEPTDRGYIELGNLAGDPNCWYFWGRAGLHSENVLRVIPAMRESLQKSRLADLEIVRAGSGARRTHLKKQKLVAIPLLKVVAAAHGEPGGHSSSLLSGPVESLIAAPKDWCHDKRQAPVDDSCQSALVDCKGSVSERFSDSMCPIRRVLKSWPATAISHRSTLTIVRPTTPQFAKAGGWQARKICAMP
jgi:hypothetical protein